LQLGLKHIAEKCGVSAMAVSMALRDHSSISQQRRKDIKAMAERMGYRPNINARSLRGGKTHSIGIIWSLGGPHNSIGLIRDISLRLMHHGYVSYIADSLGDPKIIKSCLDDYGTRNIDGLIIQIGSELIVSNEFRTSIIENLNKIANVVIVNGSGVALPSELECHEIVRQREAGTVEIIDYLVSRGREKIVMLANKLSDNREEHFIQCLKEHGVSTDDCRLIHEPHKLSSDLLDKLFINGVLHYDAVLTQHDEAAAQVINYLQQRAVKVPDDIAVIGFNDSPFAQYFTPPIASVERRSDEVVATAVELLMEKIKNDRCKLKQVELPMHFIKRQSAG
jgi:LacI family transcriptional regulator